MPERRKPPGRQMKQRFIRLVLVRHGECGGEPRQPELGPALTSLGRRQADRVARRLAEEEFDHIYSSDLARAYETAQAIRGSHPDTPYTVSEDIREVGEHFGVVDPTPELLRQRKAVARFSRRLLYHHRYGQNILVVAHERLIQLLVTLLAGLSPDKTILLSCHNTAVAVLMVSRRKPPVLVAANDVAHLLPGQVT